MKGGLRARELCALTARGIREEDAEGAGGTGAPGVGGLSVEAVTAHTGTGASVVGGWDCDRSDSKLLFNPVSTELPRMFVSQLNIK